MGSSSLLKALFLLLPSPLLLLLLPSPSSAQDGGCPTNVINPITGVCEPECYCIPDTGCTVGGSTGGYCPPLGDRVIPASPEGIRQEFFFSLMKVDDPDSLFTFEPPGCQPYKAVADFLNNLNQQAGLPIVPYCEGVTQRKDPSSTRYFLDGDDMMTTCSFVYEETFCDDGSYNLMNTSPALPEFEMIWAEYGDDSMKKISKRSKNSKKSSTQQPTPEPTQPPTKMPTQQPTPSPTMSPTQRNIFLTHESACGVCSSAQDLVTMLSPTFDLDYQRCTASYNAALLTFRNNPTNPEAFAALLRAFPELVQCFLSLGFTSDCAHISASNSVHTVLVVGSAASVASPNNSEIPPSCFDCARTCLSDPLAPDCTNAILPGTCSLTSCFECDEIVSGPIYAFYAGRTRRRSGIVTVAEQPNIGYVGTKRPCSVIPNIGQQVDYCKT